MLLTNRLFDCSSSTVNNTFVKCPGSSCGVTARPIDCVAVWSILVASRLHVESMQHTLQCVASVGTMLHSQRKLACLQLISCDCGQLHKMAFACRQAVCGSMHISLLLYMLTFEDGHIQQVNK